MVTAVPIIRACLSYIFNLFFNFSSPRIEFLFTIRHNFKAKCLPHSAQLLIRITVVRKPYSTYIHYINMHAWTIHTVPVKCTRCFSIGQYPPIVGQPDPTLYCLSRRLPPLQPWPCRLKRFLHLFLV